MNKGLMIAVVGMASLCVLGTAQATILHQQDFEGGTTADWNSYKSTLTIGTDSTSGNKYLVLTDPTTIPEGYHSGAYSWLGGARSNLGVNWSSSADVFIDLNDSRIATGKYGFDLTQAMYDTGGSHEQDNIFHVGAADPEGDGTYSVYLNASHNTDFETNAYKLTHTSPAYSDGLTPGVFTESGWYTFGVSFAESTDPGHPNHIDVQFSVHDDQGTEFWATSPKTSVMSRAESLAMAGLVVGTVAPTKPMLAWLSGFGLLVLS